MSILAIAARIKPIRLNRNRRGYTLIEAVLVLALSSVLMYGLGVVMISTREQMWISAQLRNLDEWGMAHVNSWSHHFRHAEKNSINLRRQNPPSILEFDFVEFDDAQEVPKEYVYSHDNRTHLPLLRINGRRDNKNLFPDSSDPRDRYSAIRSGHKGFRIEKCDRPRTSGNFRDHYMTMSFTLVYTRHGVNTRASDFVKELKFTSSAYAVNPHWPGSAASPGFEGPGG